MKRTVKQTTQQTVTKVNKSNLEQLMSLWIKEGKNGKYLTGKVGMDADGFKVVGFYNGQKKNPKEPDIRIYESYDKGHAKEVLISLWGNTSKSGKLYFTGLDNENNRVVAFVEEKPEKNRPNIRIYLSVNEDSRAA